MYFKFEVGDVVTIRSRGTKHHILKLLDKGTHISALLTWRDDDYCWWPVDELEPVNTDQLDMFGDNS